MLRNLLRAAVIVATLAIASLAPHQAQAQTVTYKPPTNALTLFLPDYNYTISLWVQPGAATGFAVFVLQATTNTWRMDSLIDGGVQDLTQAVNAAGGVPQFIELWRPKINATITVRYPGYTPGTPVGSTGSVGDPTADMINAILPAVYTLKLVNGAPLFAPR